MSEEYSIKKKISDIINGESDSERARKEKIDRADDIFQFFLLLFGLGFWVIMILKMFL